MNNIVGDISIVDYSTYTDNMSRGIVDKLFWLNMIDNQVTQVVDYGCADGFLLKQLKQIDNTLSCVGYDIDPEMLKLCQQSNVKVTNNFDEITNHENSILNLSSIIHEIYSYAQTPSEIDVFYEQVFNKNFKYIAIRDMMISDFVADKVTSGYDIEKVAKWADSNNRRYMLNDFCSIWEGDLLSQKNLIHFLLKYRYTINWEREVRENYLPITLETFLEKIKKYNYSVEYSDHNVLPFLVDQIKKDMNISFTENTHLKLLLKRID